MAQDQSTNPVGKASQEEKQAARRATVLVVAALTMPRLAAQVMAEGKPCTMKDAAEWSFISAEAFANEAEAKGYDLVTALESMGVA